MGTSITRCCLFSDENEFCILPVSCIIGAIVIICGMVNVEADATKIECYLYISQMGNIFDEME
jgi:hypothetical protein